MRAMLHSYQGMTDRILSEEEYHAAVALGEKRKERDTLQELLDAGLLDPAALKRHLKKKGRAVSGFRIPQSIETRK